MRNAGPMSGVFQSGTAVERCDKILENHDMGDHPTFIDISHWESLPGVAKVKVAGVVAMIHKATEVSSYVDRGRGHPGPKPVQVYRMQSW